MEGVGPGRNDPRLALQDDRVDRRRGELGIDVRDRDRQVLGDRLDTVADRDRDLVGIVPISILRGLEIRRGVQRQPALRVDRDLVRILARQGIAQRVAVQILRHHLAGLCGVLVQGKGRGAGDLRGEEVDRFARLGDGECIDVRRVLPRGGDGQRDRVRSGSRGDVERGDLPVVEPLFGSASIGIGVGERRRLDGLGKNRGAVDQHVERPVAVRGVPDIEDAGPALTVIERVAVGITRHVSVIDISRAAEIGAISVVFRITGIADLRGGIVALSRDAVLGLEMRCGEGRDHLGHRDRHGLRHGVAGGIGRGDDDLVARLAFGIGGGFQRQLAGRGIDREGVAIGPAGNGEGHRIDAIVAVGRVLVDIGGPDRPHGGLALGDLEFGQCREARREIRRLAGIGDRQRVDVRAVPAKEREDERVLAADELDLDDLDRPVVERLLFPIGCRCEGDVLLRRSIVDPDAPGAR